MENETFRQRGDDVADLARRLLRVLTGVRTHSLEGLPRGTILVARRLLPSEITISARRSAAGIVVEFGGPGSHCALLTREMGIPGVCQVPQATQAIATGDFLLLDGVEGAVTVSPDRPARQRFKKRMEDYQERANRARRHRHQPSDTIDGVHVPVMANVGNRKDAELAADNGADGIGLYRTEVLFMSRKMLPSEAELLEEIAYTVAPFKRKPLVIRLLDAGGDKSLPYLPLPAEDNPFLGRRGVRLLLHYPELLHVQLRALLQLSRDYNVQILVPMVTLASDMRRVRDALVSAATEMGLERVPPLGAMIETPAAALTVKAISPFADFLSIGTNDLTQYALAAGRENPLVLDYFQDTHPSILRLLSIITEDAGEKTTCLCGELAGRCELVPVLLRARLRMLSVAPPLIPLVKEAVRQAGAIVSS
jgi:phosphoenolpyruvate-protein phosphotransferase